MHYPIFYHVLGIIFLVLQILFLFTTIKKIFFSKKIISRLCIISNITAVLFLFGAVFYTENNYLRIAGLVMMVFSEHITRKLKKEK